MGPLHPVLKVRRNVDVIPRPKVDALLDPGIWCDEDQDGFALHQRYPLVFVLIEPFPRGGLLPLGEDALDAKVIPIGLNIRSVLSNLGYKVTSPAPHRQ